MLDKERIKQELDEQDIIMLLKDLGSEDSHRDKDNNLLFQTVCHNSSGGSYKLHYFKDSKTFHCYTACSDTFDVYELVRRSKLNRNIKLSFYECIKYVAALTNKNIHMSSIFSKLDKDYIIDDWDWIKKYKRVLKPIVSLSVVNDTVLDVFQGIYHQTWIDEGISIKTMEKYGIKYYIKDDKIVIPHYDINSNLVGIRGRALREDDILAKKKYMPLIVEKQQYSHPLALNLYGLNHTQETIKKIKKVIIFEGEKSCLKCEDFYGENNFSIAVCGMSISPQQRSMILSLQPKEIFIGFDKQFKDTNSNEAYKFAEKLLKIAMPFTPYCQVYILWDDANLLDHKDSPCDKGKEILEVLMKHKYEIKTKNGEEVQPCNIS